AIHEDTNEQPCSKSLTCLCENGVHTSPSLVIIDGLDKCNNTEVQSRIINTIGEIL
ncbi:hypothetical protein BDQ17DRAFT_1222618, partial [Cyathus striatus]